MVLEPLGNTVPNKRIIISNLFKYSNKVSRADRENSAIKTDPSFAFDRDTTEQRSPEQISTSQTVQHGRSNQNQNQNFSSDE